MYKIKIKKNIFKFKILKSATKNDIEQLNNIYLNSLPNDILNYFGNIVKIKYIKFFLNNQNGRIIVAYLKKKIIGFIFLRFKYLNMIKILDIKSAIRFFLIAFFKPNLLIRLIYQILFPINKKKKICEIDCFAVLKKYRSNNIGKKLINFAESIALKKKYSEIYTKTYNTDLINFYCNKKDAIILKSYKILNYKYHFLCWKIN